MSYPVQVQTPEELQRECLGCIGHVAADLALAAEAGNADAVQLQYDFLKRQMIRLETIRNNVRRH